MKRGTTGQKSLVNSAGTTYCRWNDLELIRSQILIHSTWLAMLRFPIVLFLAPWLVSPTRTIIKELRAGLVVMRWSPDKRSIQRKTLHMPYRWWKPVSINFLVVMKTASHAQRDSSRKRKTDIVDINMGCPVKQNREERGWRYGSGRRQGLYRARSNLAAISPSLSNTYWLILIHP